MRCSSCGRPADYAVVVDLGPTGGNAFYCPPCAAAVPEGELTETLRSGRMCVELTANGHRRRR
jgi:hypothetical protein